MPTQHKHQACGGAAFCVTRGCWCDTDGIKVQTADEAWGDGTWRACLLAIALSFVLRSSLFALFYVFVRFFPVKSLEGGGASGRMGTYARARRVGSEPAFAICVS